MTLHAPPTDRAKSAWKYSFSATALLICGLIGWQTERNVATQRDLNVRLDKIQHNTETPPTVSVPITVPGPTIIREQTPIQAPSKTERIPSFISKQDKDNERRLKQREQMLGFQSQASDIVAELKKQSPAAQEHAQHWRMKVESFLRTNVNGEATHVFDTAIDGGTDNPSAPRDEAQAVERQRNSLSWMMSEFFPEIQYFGFSGDPKLKADALELANDISDFMASSNRTCGTMRPEVNLAANVQCWRQTESESHAQFDMRLRSILLRMQRIGLPSGSLQYDLKPSSGQTIGYTAAEELKKLAARIQ